MKGTKKKDCLKEKDGKDNEEASESQNTRARVKTINTPRERKRTQQPISGNCEFK